MVIVPLGHGAINIHAAERSNERGRAVTVSFSARTQPAPVGEDVSEELQGSTFEQERAVVVLAFGGDAPVESLDALMDQLLRARRMLTGPKEAA